MHINQLIHLCEFITFITKLIIIFAIIPNRSMMCYLQTICDRQLHYDPAKDLIWFLHAVIRVTESVISVSSV
jgi:hypothetical protein